MIGASRFYADRYFAPRYWPKVGVDAAPVTEETVSFDLYVDQGRSFSANISRSRAIHLYIEQSRSFDHER